MSDVRFISWSAMILDERDEVRAAGYRSAPADLSGAVGMLERALERYGKVGDDALSFLESHDDPRAREILVSVMTGAPWGVAQRIRVVVSHLDARRHLPDPRVIVPVLEPWPEQPAPSCWAECAYAAVDKEIGRLRKSITVSRRLAGANGEADPDEPGSYVAQTREVIRQLSAVTMADCDETARAIGGNGTVHPLLRRLAGPGRSQTLHAQLSPLQRLRLELDANRPSVLMTGVDYAGLDLRLFADAAARIGVRRPVDRIAEQYLARQLQFLDATLAWPFFVEHPGPLDDALGLAVPEAPAEDAVTAKALRVLEDMPVLPRRYLPRAVELATIGKAGPRRAARKVVEAHGDPVAAAKSGLAHTQWAVRASAAGWLADLGATAARPAIEEALATESSTPVREALTAALGRLKG